MTFQDEIKEKGVVGAGGAGFPTHVKLGAKAHTVLVNAAECEPLLHKDKQLLFHHGETVFKGLTRVMAAVGAGRGIMGIKAKHGALIEALSKILPRGVEICPVDDFYPAGDEITLIREACQVIVPPGELPISQGIVVNNVESLYNMGKPGPVTTKFLNLAGEVENRHTLEVPLGLSFRALLDYARPIPPAFTVIEGGPMMGRMVTDLDRVVTKTTAALIVLPNDHVLVKKYQDMADQKVVDRIGKSACDQCSFCTELCPRYLLGHPIQPHKAMRSLVFQAPGADGQPPQAHALYCCQCNLCSFVSCPEGLYPSQVCIHNRRRALAEKVRYKGALSNPAHPLASYRKTPSSKLKRRLDLNRFPDTGPLTEYEFTPQCLTLMLCQHIGAPALPLVGVGDEVTPGMEVADPGENLGAKVHSPSAGKVVRVDTEAIVIQCYAPAEVKGRIADALPAPKDHPTTV